MLCVHERRILAFDFANENPSISKPALEGCRLRFSARELPNLHTCTSAHVQGQNGMSRMHFITCIARHQCGFGCFFKHSNIDAKGFSVPFPGLVHIGNTNANLLDAADEFAQEVKIG